MKSILIILLGLVVSWRYLDFSSDSTVGSVVAPIGLFVFLILLACWIVLGLHKMGVNQTTSRDALVLFSDNNIGDGGAG